ncbi:MAG: FAD-dependent monooxygenase [Lachnospiraceae bacterium]|nr:FAD-dependent monooxygenase [Lachnospiraceae bacterium]
MIRITQLKCRPGHKKEELEVLIRRTQRLRTEESFSYEIARQSIDARKKPDLFYVYTVDVHLSDPKHEKSVLAHSKARNASITQIPVYRYTADSVPDVLHTGQEPPIIVGTGPAGLFCGLLLARQGLRPILIEQGDRARQRTSCVQTFWDTGVLDPYSNVQFGEGGAGTFSDGKLNTGIKDPEGRIRFILKTFVEAGADPDILYSYKPHVGTDVLTRVVSAITDEIVERGGSVYFRTRMTKLAQTRKGKWELTCARKDPEQAELHLETSRVVLAIGHSARSTFRMLQEMQVSMTPKAFAVGVRIQHPQERIDRALYGEGCMYSMPPSPYKVTHHLADGRGVYSFCMCPGGYVVNASSEEGMIAVNGMSYHGRDSGNANSAIVVTITPQEIVSFLTGEERTDAPAAMSDVLLGMEFQRKLEQAAYREGKGRIPLQQFEDFRRNETGSSLPSFEPRIMGAWKSANLRNVLPQSICSGIEEGILAWDRQITGFADPHALLAGVESRTSSPVRMERGADLQAEGHPGLYPCGEGAGYAGGITSAAADGLKVAEEILRASQY